MECGSEPVGKLKNKKYSNVCDDIDINVFHKKVRGSAKRGLKHA